MSRIRLQPEAPGPLVRDGKGGAWGSLEVRLAVPCIACRRRVRAILEEAATGTRKHARGGGVRLVPPTRVCASSRADGTDPGRLPVVRARRHAGKLGEHCVGGCKEALRRGKRRTAGDRRLDDVEVLRPRAAIEAAAAAGRPGRRAELVKLVLPRGRRRDRIVAVDRVAIAHGCLAIGRRQRAGGGLHYVAGRVTHDELVVLVVVHSPLGENDIASGEDVILGARRAPKTQGVDPRGVNEGGARQNDVVCAHDVDDVVAGDILGDVVVGQVSVGVGDHCVAARRVRSVARHDGAVGPPDLGDHIAGRCVSGTADVDSRAARIARLVRADCFGTGLGTDRNGLSRVGASGWSAEHQNECEAAERKPEQSFRERTARCRFPYQA